MERCFHFSKACLSDRLARKTNTTVLKNVSQANIETNVQHKHKPKDIYCKRNKS